MKTITKNKNAVVLFITILLLLLANFKILAQCPTAPGNPSVYGSGSWIGYVYADGTASAPSPQTNTFSTPYRGFLTQPENFYQDLGSGAISGANICGSYSNRFSISFRMQRTFVAGTYNITVGGDDGYRLSLDGGSTWAINNWGIFAYQSTNITVSLSGTRNLVLEYFENDGVSAVSFAICQGNSTAPTGISGTNIICSGSSTTLTANGGIEGVGSFYQWGTGATVGSNIITGQNAETLTVAPSTTTTYWVRRRESAPCNITTSGVTYVVTVNANSTAPTSITGASTICAGQSLTLTASGGTTGSGASFEWGTGTVGTNIIVGATNATLLVSPTSTTTYWVRRINASPCSTSTAAVSATVNVTNVGGDEISYGNDEWIGYVYSQINTTNPPSNVFAVDYKGYFTQPEQFNLNLSNNIPLQGPNICGSYLDRFSVRFKMNKTFAPGYYTITLGGDDGVRLSLDGGATFVLGNFSDQSYTTFTQTFYLSGSMNLVIEYYEQGGFSQVSFNYVACSNINTAPTGISGTSDLCVGTGGTTLTAIGGNASPGSTYQWGTGTVVGSNIIGGQTNISMYINPSVNTTYWVRRIGGNCNIVTDGVTLAVNVAVRSTNPTNISGTTSICQGNSVTLTATGGTTAAGGSFQWGTGFTAGSNILAGETSASITVTPSATTTYWVRRVDSTPCNTETSARTITISVTTPSIAPTAITGVTEVCSNATSTSLTAVGGFRGSNGNYQWGTGSVIGSNIIGGQTNATIFINPSSTTTYWVRLVDGSPCSNTTAGVTQVVTVSSAAVNPTSISGITTICNGDSTILTAIGGSAGTNSEFQWGIDNTIGSDIIAGETNASITVSPTTTTTYWVRRVDASPCATLTWGRTTTVTVRNASIAPTGISGNFDLCAGAGGTTLTATGGTLGSNASYQWGTGTIIGSNIISGQTNVSLYINPGITTTYWVRIVDGTPCSQNTSGVSQLVNVSIRSSAPTGISGIVTICEGTSLTLTAIGGTEGTNSEYEWGTGSTVGLNTIIGETANTITVTPSTTTNYWVRRLDSAPCAGVTGGIVRTVTVRNLSIAPTGISGNFDICFANAQTTLTAVGGTLGSNAIYQWGTGTTIGSNIINGAFNASVNVNPSSTTTYWVRIIDNAPCSQITDAVSQIVNVSIRSTTPSSLSGTSTVCEGTSVTLTAVGGTVGTNCTYEWGIGSTVGSNIIAGETNVSIDVTPSMTTTYWVRRVDGAPCNSVTGGRTTIVTVRAASTAPTSITGAGSASCSGTSRTLTATGGTAASGSTFEWGTGTLAGSNVISGQTGASITVNPSTTTTYWVRRRDAAPCSTITDAAFTTVTITTAPGDPNDFGNNVWNLYGYNGSDLNLTSAFYQGFYTVGGLNFTTQSGTNSWSNNASPSASAGWNGCPVTNNNFTFTVKRRGFDCGNYTLRLNNWDDQTRVYVNGVIVWTCNVWSGSGAACNGLIGTYNLDATSTIEIRVRENSGGSNVSLAFTKNDISPTNPTSISGVTTLCSGGTTTLVATGGTMGTNGSFQWGIGSTIGSNIISGQTTASMTVTPTTTTTYWTRRIDTLCNIATAGMLFTVTVTQPTVSGSLSTPSPLTCSNRTPEAISLTGNVGNVLMWQYASNAAFTTGITNIASTSTTLTSAQIGTLTATRYFRAMVQNGNCAFVYTTPVAIIVPETVVYNGTWSGTPTSETPAIISANLTLTGTLHVCSCEVNNNAVVTVPGHTTLLVEKDVNVASSSNIVIENNGSLVQRDNATVNIGSITMKRNTTPMKQFDYTYWSSPVENFTLNALSPNTLFDKYFHYNPMISNWVVILNGLQTMLPGKGYIVRAPQGWSNTNASGGIYSATFVGKPNSGIINVPVQKGPSVLNLIGNPYPSAIDIDQFIMNPSNAGLFNGTIYLWTHNTAISSAIPGGWAYNYTNDDYAKYNLTGGVKTASFAITRGVAPTGKVAAGQAFFIEMQSSLANGNYNGVFNNDMRVVNQNSQFFRPNMSLATASTLEKNRLWLNISNPNGAYDETLIGYITGATNGMDYGYDGKVLPGNNVVGLYTMIGATNLSIQGRALPFSNQEVIPLGYKSTIAGNLTIAIENVDGFFTNQNVILRDKLLNIDHPLNQGGYTFTTTAGTFNSRFEIRFASSNRAILDVVKTDTLENTVSIFKSNERISIASELEAIGSVSIFDVTGKLLFQMKDINENEFKTKDLNIASQVLIVKVTLKNDEVITKKVIF